MTERESHGMNFESGMVSRLPFLLFVERMSLFALSRSEEARSFDGRRDADDFEKLTPTSPPLLLPLLLRQLQTWNKACFTGGYVEVSAALPGNNVCPFLSSRPSVFSRRDR